jgi:hypothetical protein
MTQIFSDAAKSAQLFYHMLQRRQQCRSVRVGRDINARSRALPNTGIVDEPA